MNFFDNHPILTFFLIIFVPTIVISFILGLAKVPEETGSIIAGSVSVLGLIGACIYSYKYSMDELKDKFKALGSGIKGFFRFIIGVIVVALVIYLIILTLPMQIALWAWILRLIFVVGGIVLLIALVSATIGY